MRLWLGILIIAVAAIPLARAEEDAPVLELEIKPRSGGAKKKRVSKIDIPKEQKSPVFPSLKADRGRVKIRGTLNKLDWSLFCEDDASCPNPSIQVDPKTGEFEAEIVIGKGKTDLVLLAVGPSGEIERHPFQTKVGRGWPDSELVAAPEPTPTATPAGTQVVVTGGGIIYLGLAPTFLRHEESGFNAINEGTFTAKIGFQTVIGKNPAKLWTFTMFNFFTLPPFSYTREPTISYLGINLRIGRPFSKPVAPLKLTLSGGLYYLTSFSQQNAFGFSNLIGPQVVGALDYTRKNGQIIIGRLKISPVMGGILPTGAEIALGGNYVFAKNKVPLSIDLDISDLRFTVSDTRVRVFSLSAGVTAPLDSLINEIERLFEKKPPTSN